jgi:electron transport complex protein RnfD
MSPATLPYSLLIFGCSLAIGVKHIFGGKDNYIFNPTAVAFAFLIICYPANMLLFPSIGEILPVFGEVPLPVNVGIENFLLRRGEFPALAPLDIILGNFPGPIGTTHVLIIIISAVCLLFRRSVSFVVTVSCLSVITISRILFPIYDDVIGALVRELFGGYLLFSLLFLANDPQTVPKTVFGRLYYGVLLGILTIVFRGSNDGVFRGRVEGWFIFALLIANTVSYRMDLYAARVASGCAFFIESLKERLSAYERFREGAKSGNEFTGDITVTMEIDLDLTNYHMPAISNKVIKINRKKRNVLTYISEIPSNLREKAKNRREKREEHKNTGHEPSFIAESYKTLFDSVKHLKPATAGEQVHLSDENSAAEISEPKSNIKITDFEEIADTVSKIEARAEAKIKAKEAEEAEKARIEAEEAAVRAAEEEAKVQAELAKAEAKVQAELAKAEAKAQKEAEKAEKKAAKAANAAPLNSPAENGDSESNTAEDGSPAPAEHPPEEENSKNNEEPEV